MSKLNEAFLGAVLSTAMALNTESTPPSSIQEPKISPRADACEPLSNQVERNVSEMLAKPAKSEEERVAQLKLNESRKVLGWCKFGEKRYGEAASDFYYLIKQRRNGLKPKDSTPLELIYVRLKMLELTEENKPVTIANISGLIELLSEGLEANYFLPDDIKATKELRMRLSDTLKPENRKIA